jgi:predicted ATPase
VFEDLGFADGGSMQIISSLVTDHRSKNVLIAGTCCSAKVCSSLLPCGRQQWGVNVVELPGLSVDTVTWMVADLLKKPYIKLGECANYIAQKINGNAFHVLQLIQYLEKSGMFVGSNEEEWKCDISLIQQAANGPVDLGNSLSLLQYKIDNLTEQMKEILEIAACMGSCSDVSLFKDIALMSLGELSRNGNYRLDIAGVDQILDECKKESLLKIGCNGKFKFVNEMVQNASIKMIPETILPHYHNAIGNRALVKAKITGLDTFTNDPTFLISTALSHLQ